MTNARVRQRLSTCTMARLTTQRYPARRSRRVRVERVVGRAEDLRSRSSSRSALLTARSFGNALATFGSRTTTFVASRTRCAYLPRTSVPKSERLYSGRRSSVARRLALFIDLPLAWCCGSCADDPDCIVAVGVSDSQKAAAGRDAEGDEPLFAE